MKSSILRDIMHIATMTRHAPAVLKVGNGLDLLSFARFCFWHGHSWSRFQTVRDVKGSKVNSQGHPTARPTPVLITMKGLAVSRVACLLCC